MKVYIDGYGAVCAAGKNIQEISDTFKNAKVVPDKSTHLNTKIDYPVFEVKNINAVNNECRTFSLLKCALDEMFENSVLKETNLSKYTVGACFGTTVACQLNDLNFYREYKYNNNLKISPVKKYLNSNLAAEIKKIYNLTGPDTTIVNACTSGTDAIGTAWLWIKNGFCDIAVAGGADEINKVPLSGFGALNNMSENPCRPFDKNRQGLNIGEGAGTVLLISEKVIQELNLDLNIEVSSYSTATDAYHLTAPSPEGVGLQKAIKSALSLSSAKPKEIAFINAHGTATKDNDLVEGRVFSTIFGNDVKFLSTKGFTGHTLGAAGALEAIFTIYGLKNRWIPKSEGFENFDEKIGVKPVTEITEINQNLAISTSLAFGGNNSVLMFKRQ